MIHFDRLPEVMHKILEETIEIQLSKSPEKAKTFIDKYTSWGEIHEHIAGVHKKLGLKPYKEIRMHF